MCIVAFLLYNSLIFFSSSAFASRLLIPYAETLPRNWQHMLFITAATISKSATHRPHIYEIMFRIFRSFENIFSSFQCKRCSKATGNVSANSTGRKTNPTEESKKRANERIDRTSERNDRCFLTKQFFCKRFKSDWGKCIFFKLCFRALESNCYFELMTLKNVWKILCSVSDAEKFSQHESNIMRDKEISRRKEKKCHSEYFSVHLTFPDGFFAVIYFFVKRNFNVIFILNDSFEANIFRLESAEKEYFQLLFTWMWRLHICTIQLVYTIDKFCIHKQGATHFN